MIHVMMGPRFRERVPKNRPIHDLTDSVLIQQYRLQTQVKMQHYIQCLNCEQRSGGTLEARRRDERRRRKNRGAVGAQAKGGNGEGCPPPQPTRGAGKRHELPSGVWGRAPAENELVHFVAARRTLIATIFLISVSLNTAVVHSHYCFERCKMYNNVIG